MTPTHWLWEGTRRAPMNHGVLWRGVKNIKGTYAGNMYAHVAAYTLFIGPVPKGKMVLHCCPERHIAFCVCPDHLYLGDADDNARDMREQIEKGFIDATGREITKGERNIILMAYTGKHGEQTELAKKFNITAVRVSQLVKESQANKDRKERERIERERPRNPPGSKGEYNPNATITQAIANQIRAESTGAFGEQTRLAKKYGIKQPAIWKILNHLIW